MQFPEYIIGIDLHGTLLNKNWTIEEAEYKKLISNITVLKNKAQFYICSGNNSGFLLDYLPLELLEIMDGFVLETGCVLYSQGSSQILTSIQQQKIMRELKNKLAGEDLPDFLFFADRLTTISLFTRNEQKGNSPEKLYKHIRHLLETWNLTQEVFLTHSDVAVDIIPQGFHKYEGLSKIATQVKFVGIADSVNDLDLLEKCDYAFVPANFTPSLKYFLTKPMKALGESSELDQNKVFISSYPYTQAVNQVLEFLAVKV